MVYQVAGLAIVVIGQIVAFVVFLTKIQDKLNTLADGQVKTQANVDKLVDALGQRTVAEATFTAKITSLEVEVARLREWRHSFGQTEWAKLTQVCARLEEVTGRVLSGRAS